MYRTITPIAVLGAALVLAVPAFGQGQPGDPQWMQALEARSQELNRQHGPQAYPESAIAVRRAIEARQRESGQPQWMRALELRGQALNLQHGPQAYPQSVVAVNRAIQARQRLESAARREVASMLDARERAFGTKLYVHLSTSTPPDAFERAVAAGPVGGSMLDRFVANDNRFQPRSTPTVAVSVGSGSEIEWPQIGMGFGIGIALVLALLLGVRATRHRPLAH